MKITILILLSLFCYKIGYSQFSEQLIISTEAAFARSVYAADINGDGYMDVLSASEHDDKIAWYENTDGLGNFGAQNIITQTLNSSVDVYAADLDGDGDMDVLAASKGITQFDSKVVWFKNLDGQGNFSDEIIISTIIQSAVAVYAIDLDGDLDLDVLSASFSDNTVAWFENDGLGNFGSRQIITNSASSTRDVYAADIDGDNDMDVLTVSTGTDKVIWFENLDGMGNFGNENIISSIADGVASAYAIDIDGDNDLDVVSASFGDEKVAWYENTDGLGNFGSEQIITESLNSTIDIYAADLDNDGDNDVLSCSANEDRVVWFENLDGLGDFSSEQIISTETDFARSVYATDIDGDGDMDVLSASRVDNKIAWYKNLTPLDTDEFFKETISLHPNPVSNILTIDNNIMSQMESVKIYDVLGRLVLQESNPAKQLNVSNLSNGLLFVYIETDKGVLVKKVLKE